MKNRHVLLFAVAGLFTLFALLTAGAEQISLTADEPAYVALGYGLLARGQGAFPLLTGRGYTPLLIALEALPVYAAKPHIPVEQLDGWPNDYGVFSRALKPYWAALPQLKLLVRMPIILLTVTLGAIVFRWGKELWGARGALLALGILIFDPLLLAHGRLANSDAGTVALGTAALYAAWRWRQKPAWRWALAAGALLGLTLLAKISGPLWLAASGVMVLTALIQLRPIRFRFNLLGQAVVAGALSLAMLWAGYGFEWGTGSHFPIPLPAPTHWENLLYLTRYTDNYFALGFNKVGGWWWYFPVAFFIKNPLPLLIGLGLSLAALRRRLTAVPGFLALGLFPLLYIGVAIYQGMDLGYRFILPVHPFLYLVIGGGLGIWMSGKSLAGVRRWGLAILAVWYVVMTLRVFPYELSFFNELVGGPDGGYRYLADSNVDWGQTVNVAQAYVQAHPETQTRPPAAKYHPAPGQYLVSASYLGGVGLADPEAYEWFRQRTPQTILAHSLLIYDVLPAKLAWLAQCEKPVTPLDEAAIASGLGQTDLRQVSFDCTQAWLYPGGGASQGLYALHHALFDEPRLCLPAFLACPPSPTDPFIARHLAQARFSFERTRDDALSAFVLYETDSSTVPGPASSTAYAANLASFPQPLNADALKQPVAMNGPLAWLGATAYFGNDAWEVETWWRVVKDPGGRPFSIMGHLISGDGQDLGVADGLGVSVAALQAGDVIVQRHRFARPPAKTDVSFLTGAYWLDSLERWSIGSKPDADMLLLKLR